MAFLYNLVFFVRKFFLRKKLHKSYENIFLQTKFMKKCRKIVFILLFFFLFASFKHAVNLLEEIFIVIEPVINFKIFNFISQK